MGDSLKIETVLTGLLQVNTYIISSGNKAIVIDPGGNAEIILPFLDGIEDVLILLTHSHYDHIGGINELLDALPKAEYYAHSECAARASDPALNLSKDILGIEYVAKAADRELADKEEIIFANLTIQSLHVPGHAPGHMVYYIPQEKVAFCGDTIFAHSIGRSDLPGGDGWDLMQNCRGLLAYLPEETVLYPGHGPTTTAGEEKATNPFL